MRSLFAVLGSLAAVGCGPATQTFPLTVEKGKAEATLAKVARCATEIGHRPVARDGTVVITVATERKLTFRVASGDKLSMATEVASDDDRGGLPGLKALGDAIWECASVEKTPPKASAEPALDPAPTAAPTTSPKLPEPPADPEDEPESDEEASDAEDDQPPEVAEPDP